MEVLGSGIIHYVSSDYSIISRGSKIFRSFDSGESWQHWFTLPVSNLDYIVSYSRILTRLTRKEVHHILKIRDNQFVCFAYGQIFLISGNSGNVFRIGVIEGSRPLRVCVDENRIYYGEYKSNKSRVPISLFQYELEKKEWSIIHTFDGIRHIHGVYNDPYESRIWVTTGDLDGESTIWQLNESDVPEKIATGSQQTRTVDLLFTEKDILYATDAPDEPNYICRLNRKTHKIERLQRVGGAIFYGRKVNNYIFFSTIVEPSDINRTDAIELWVSSNHGKSWKKLKEFNKDIGHMKLFQYGQIKFPYGPGDGKNVWFTPYATNYDHKVVKMPLEL